MVSEHGFGLIDDWVVVVMDEARLELKWWFGLGSCCFGFVIGVWVR